MDCTPFNFCDNDGCGLNNCDDCVDADLGYSVKYCGECGESYCGDCLMKNHIEYGEDDYCSGCNERATLQLESCNERFEYWVKELEERYGSKYVPPLSTDREFSDALQARELLRQRCNEVGNKLSFKQKQFERFDSKCKRYESDLTL